MNEMPSFSALFDELVDRVDRVEQHRDEWASGLATGDLIRARLREIAALAQHMEAAQVGDDRECAALAKATPADFTEDPR
ncbi:hypothetical protein [Streptomonospora nanhaiensis]|uniref:hypothetical protein n=1 Tax=Streptomonospora nanhaiensis TaxID=1323731 RepID=UPI001C37FC76|nr:hypothetical protein [Streptomonospora nanhaiensis]MBV2366943.1 hypothetical protein [Streptomonospora nanhaiensis]